MTRAPRLHEEPGHLREEDVLAVVIELSGDFRAPSTSLITWRLAGDSTVTSAFQSAVRAALQQLRARGTVSCVVHRGTHRWSTTRDSQQPPT